MRLHEAVPNLKNSLSIIPTVAVMVVVLVVVVYDVVVMAIRVVEFSNGVYKIRKIFA